MKIQLLPPLPALSPSKVNLTAIDRFLQGLRLGEVLQAKVLHRTAEGQWTVQIGEHKLLASHHGPLEKGSILRVEVISRWPDTLLRILSSGSERETALQRLLWKALPFMEAEGGKQLWSKTSRELGALQMVEPGAMELSHLLRSGPKGGLQDLLGFLKASGLLLEAKLAGRMKGVDSRNRPDPDLKAQLLRALQSQERQGSAPFRGLLDLIKGSQALNVFSREGQTHIYVPLFFWGFQRKEWGDLTIRGRREDRANQERGWSVTIRLDLDDFGRLLIQMNLDKRSLSCSLRAEKRSTQQRIEAAVHQLQERLSSIGFRAVICHCGAIEDMQEWADASGIIPEGLLRVTA